MPIDYGSNNVSTSGNFVAASGNFTTALTVNGVPVATGVGGGATISNAADNRVLTSDGTSTGINGESNLTFNGTTLAVTGVIDIDNLRLDGNTISSTNSNGNIVIAPNGTGDVQVDADTLRVGDSNANTTITTNGTGNLTLNTNANNNSGNIIIQQGANNSIILQPHGVGSLRGSSTGDPRGSYATDWQRYRDFNDRVASASYSTIGGGINNRATAGTTVVAGGGANTASGYQSAICGGAINTASGAGSFVGGGSSNTASGTLSTVGGGSSNTASGTFSTVGGGTSNAASGYISTVGGGYANSAISTYSTIGGGFANTTNSTSYATVGGGHSNAAMGDYATIGGGRQNTSSGTYSTVGGGRSNTSSGNFSTVAGGLQAVASLYGEEARSSGKFNVQGDAQTRKFILRNKSQGSTPINLYLDKLSEEILIPENCSWFYHIKVIARNADDIETAAYEFKGAIERSNLITVILGDTKTVIYEDNVTWDCDISIFNDSILRIESICDTNQNDVYWVAYVEIVQVIVPSLIPSYS